MAVLLDGAIVTIGVLVGGDVLLTVGDGIKLGILVGDGVGISVGVLVAVGGTEVRGGVGVEVSIDASVFVNTANTVLVGLPTSVISVGEARRLLPIRGGTTSEPTAVMIAASTAPKQPRIPTIHAAEISDGSFLLISFVLHHHKKKSQI